MSVDNILRHNLDKGNGSNTSVIHVPCMGGDACMNGSCMLKISLCYSLFVFFLSQKSLSTDGYNIPHNTQIAHNTCSGEKKATQHGGEINPPMLKGSRESSESSDTTSCRSWCKNKSPQQMKEDHGISQPPKNNKNPDHHPTPLLAPPVPENSSPQSTSPPPTQKNPSKEDIPKEDFDKRSPIIII